MRAFAERTGAAYPILVAGRSDPKLAAQAFPALDRVESFPTTLFLRADGSVHSVRSGWGDERAEYEALVAELLAAPEPDHTSRWRELIEGSWGGDWSFSELGGDRRARRGGRVLGEEPVRLLGDAVVIGDAVHYVDGPGHAVLDALRPFRRGNLDFFRARETLPTEGLRSTDPLARREAALVIADYLHSDDSMPRVAALLRDADVRVQAAAVRACRLAPYFAPLDELLELARHPSAIVRRAVAEAFSAYPHLVRTRDRSDAVPARLRELADDPDPLVRRFARGE